tara:strand:- start:444 stop:1334 length:891 start_codon:yes stop_codon:yes gene_type:complete
MSIYLGGFGKVMLQRKTAQGDLFATINTDDVNTSKKRFSFDEADELITGDQIEISTTNGTDLLFIAAASWAGGSRESSFTAFVHKDDLGGIRLFSTFANAVNGGSTNALTLTAISSAIPVKVSVQNAIYRMLGQVSSYELNTDVESVDITALSDYHRERYSSLISGNGRITCAWDYEDSEGSGTYDPPHYLLELVTRTKVGSEFGAQLYLKTSGYNPSGISSNLDDELWYEINAVVVQSAISFNVGQPVDMTINFVTTGGVDLKINSDAANKILQEDSDDILLEQDTTAKLLQETD